LVKGFLRSGFSVVSRWGWVLVGLNWLFFGLIVVGSLLVEAGVFGVSVWPFGEVAPVEISNPVLLFGFIFVFNLALSGFALMTLTGVLFFGLSIFFLGFRGFLWGTLAAGLSTPMFLAALPTLILEGEAYVLAALAGVNLGLSWFQPKWVYKEEKDGLSRSEALRRALRESAYVYVFVVALLFAAAILETMTLVFI